MREFKFRAWDSDNKKMLEPFTIESLCDGGWYDHPKWVVMQYTGLKDKNGKEVYEDDVVQGWELINLDTGIGIDSHEVETSTFIVEWDEDVCGWNLYGASNFKVIGNKFENPELLEKEVNE